MNKSLRILVDLDGIVADFLGGLLVEYNKVNKVGDYLTVDHITTWDMSEHAKDPKLLFRIFRKRGFFRHLAPVPGAVAGLKALVTAGHEVVILSAPCTHTSASEKLAWCEEHLPFIHHKNIFIGHRKHMLQGDVLIDDGPHNAKDYREVWPFSHIYTIAYPYNKVKPGEEYIYNGRFGSLAHSEKAWSEIVEAISRVADIPLL